MESRNWNADARFKQRHKPACIHLGADKGDGFSLAGVTERIMASISAGAISAKAKLSQSPALRLATQAKPAAS